MADLYLGQSFSRFYRLQSAGAIAETITDVGFRPDKVVVWNRTAWAAGAGNRIVQSTWVRDMAAASALQLKRLVDDGATMLANTTLITTLGITITTNASGVDGFNGTLSTPGITTANPPVATSTAHGRANGDTVRITDVVGTVEANNRRFRINNVTTNTFELQDPETRVNVDGSNWTTWVSGGRWNQLNMVDADRVVFDAVTYDVILGTAVMDTDNDILGVELFKYGQYTDLGDVA